MDDHMRRALAEQGLGFTLHVIRCSSCFYIARGLEEEGALERRQPCPKCGQSGPTAQLGPNSYFTVANWVGEYAISKNPRDHAAAVILFCAWVESLIETLKETRAAADPQLKIQYAGKDMWKVRFKDLFPGAPSALLDKAPPALRAFWGEFTTLRKLRDSFLHGTGSYVLGEKHAREALDLAPLAINAYAWLNNNYCLKT